MRLTTVVNLHKKTPYDIYVGRARKHEPPSKWSNPYIIGQPILHAHIQLLQTFNSKYWKYVGQTVDRYIALELYREYLNSRIRNKTLSATDFSELYGKTLGCFCKPNPCHGDILALYADWFALHPDAPTGPPTNWT